LLTQISVKKNLLEHVILMMIIGWLVNMGRINMSKSQEEKDNLDCRIA